MLVSRAESFIPFLHLPVSTFKMRMLDAIKVVVVVGFLFYESESIQFELQSGNTKCVAEDLRINSMTVGKYSVINPNDGQPLPNSHKIVVGVTSSSGTSFHQSDPVESGQFGFVASEGGDYMTCLWAPPHDPVATLTVNFEWKSGVAAKGWTNVAKKGSVESLAYELKMLYDNVMSIQEEMLYLREREEEMQELNRATNTKMAGLSFLSLLVCLSVAGLQLWHLKSFFEKKKII